MSLELKRVEKPFSFALKDSKGNICMLDASESIGGNGMGFRPMELLAGSLAGCASIDIVSILNKQKIEPELFEIEINYIRKEEIPSAFKSIELVLKIDDIIDRVKLKKNVELVLAKHCSVIASMDKAIEISYKIIGRND